MYVVFRSYPVTGLIMATKYANPNVHDLSKLAYRLTLFLLGNKLLLMMWLSFQNYGFESYMELETVSFCSNAPAGPIWNII